MPHVPTSLDALLTLVGQGIAWTASGDTVDEALKRCIREWEEYQLNEGIPIAERAFEVYTFVSYGVGAGNGGEWVQGVKVRIVIV